MIRPVCLWFALLVVSGMALCGCAKDHRTGWRGARSGWPAAAKPDPQMESHARYADGVIHEMKGELDAAMDSFTEAAAKDPDDEDLALDVTRRFFQYKHPERALAVLTNAVARPHASGELFARLGFIYAQIGKPDLALAANQKAVRKTPSLLAAQQNLYLGHLQNKQEAQALKVLDNAARTPGANADYLISVAELYSNFGVLVPSLRTNVNAHARELLGRADALHSTNIVTRLKLADGFALLGESAKAIECYSALIQSLPDYSPVRIAARSKLGELYLHNDDPRHAAEQFEAILRDDPANVQANYILGSLAFDDNRMVQAAECFSRTILLNPAFEPAYYKLVRAQLNLDRAGEALATLEKARSRFQPNFLVEYLTGVTYAHRKDYAEAIKHYAEAEVIARATETNRLTHSFYYQLGVACERSGDVATAVNHFEKCLALAPDFAEAQIEPAYYELVRAQLNLDRAGEALATLEKARSRFRQNFLIEYLTGVTYAHRKDYAEAIKHYAEAEVIARATETNRLTHSFYFQFGVACERSGDFATAVNHFEKCLALSPDFAEAQNYLGYMWAERGTNLDRARDLIEKAVKAQPDNDAYLDSLGWVLFKLGKPREAFEAMSRALKAAEKPDPTMYDHLGDIHAALGEPDKAREAWRKSLELEPSETIRKKLDSTAPK